MKRICSIGLAALLGFLAFASGRAAADDPLTQRELDAIWSNYVSRDCDVGEEGKALSAVLERKEIFEPHLIRLLREGPGETDLLGAQDSAERRWEMLQRYLDSDRATGFSFSDRVRLLSVRLEGFVAMEVESLARVQRVKAAKALVAIGSPNAMRALQEVALRDEAMRPVIIAAVEAQLRRNQR